MDYALPVAQPVVLQPLNAREARNACLTEQYQALQIQQGYLSDIRFILEWHLRDLTCLALRRQTHVVIAIKQAKIRTTYNKTRLLQEHLSRHNIGNQNLHTVRHDL
jgi:hypothetical protein